MAAHSEEDHDLTMSTSGFLQAELELYHHCVAFVKSLALKAATDLRIPDAIHRRGGAATLSELAVETGIHPTKLSNLRRLMRVLTASGVFSVVQGSDHAGDAAAAAQLVSYKLTRVSRLLVERSRHHLSPMVDILVDPFAWTALLKMPEWFTHDRASSASSLFELAHGCALWDTTVDDGGLFTGGMAGCGQPRLHAGPVEGARPSCVLRSEELARRRRRLPWRHRRRRGESVPARQVHRAGPR
jgi:hypothetical protein